MIMTMENIFFSFTYDNILQVGWLVKEGYNRNKTMFSLQMITYY